MSLDRVTVGGILAVLWGFQAATTELSSAAVLQLPLLFGVSAALLFWRLTSSDLRRRLAHKQGMTLGVCCWLVTAICSAILNRHASGAPLAYIAVFLAGGAVYVAMLGLRLTPRDLEVGVTGLALGAVVPGVASVLASLGGIDGGSFALQPESSAFLIIVAPLLVGTALDARKPAVCRAICGASIIPLAISLAVLDVGLMLFGALAIGIAVIAGFKRGLAHMPIVAAVLIVAAVAVMLERNPQLVTTLVDRWTLLFSVGAMSSPGLGSGGEDWMVGLPFWLLGTGPGIGSAITETGVLCLFSVGVIAYSVWRALFRGLSRQASDEINDARVMLLVGPAVYILYSLLAPPAADAATLSTWIVLMASMLALAPPFGRSRGVESREAELVDRRSGSPTSFTGQGGSIPSLVR